MANREQVARLLDEGLTLARSLLDVLQAERKALEANNTRALQQAVAEKEALFPRMQALEQALGATLPPSARLDIPQTLSRLDPSGELAARYHALAEELQRCARENRVNGGIVELGQRYLQESLSILRGNLQTGEGTYDPCGKLHNEAGGHLLSKA
ncbi:MAG: flagellar protein FlgN [Gammaproteobacteria bacterium]|nr:MAG: flagellar protein FlgN [Gammaproteobacteria bacterium]